MASKSIAQAPDFLGAKSIGGTGNDDVQSMAVDDSGNVYMTGAFQGTVDFDPGAGLFNLYSAGFYDIYITKSDVLGNLVWARSIGSSNYDVGRSIALADNGDIYITGAFNDTVDFDPGAGIHNLISAGNTDVFILRLHSTGTFVSSISIGGGGTEGGNFIAIDPSPASDIYITGTFSGTTDFDPGVGTFYYTSVGANDIFISKFDSSDNFIWARQIGDINVEVPHSMALDISGSCDVYTTGTFQGTVDFNPGAGVLNLHSSGADDIFISKLDSSGNFVWAKRIGNTGSDGGYSIAYDPSGNGSVYTTGYFTDTTDFDPGAGIFMLPGSGSFVSKLDGSGNFVWAKSLNASYCNSIALDAVNNLYTTGIFSGTIDFDPDTIASYYLTSAGADDIFLAKSDSSGNFVYAKAAGGTGSDYGYCVALDGTGRVLVAGIFYSTSIFFDSIGLTNADSSGNSSDIFIAALDTALNTGYNLMESRGEKVFLFPNPASDHLTIAFGSINNKVEITITDITGRLIYTTTATDPHSNQSAAKGLPTALRDQKIEVDIPINIRTSGMYLVRIQTEKYVQTHKIVLTN